MQAPEHRRQIWLDCLKGFSILLVILGHVLSGYLDAGTFPSAGKSFTEVRELIYSFHMPLFFFISGYTCSLAYAPDGHIRKKRYAAQMFNLFWIYLVFALIQWAVKSFVPDMVNEAYTLADLQNMFLVPLGNFWYIYVLFFLYAIGAAIHLPKLHPLWLLFFAAVSLCVANIYLNWFHLTLYRILYHFSFFAAGSMLFARQNLLRSQKLMGITVMFLSATGVLYLSGIRTWYSNWKVMIAFFISYLLFFLFYTFPALSRVRFFRLCGRYCLEIYLLHTFFTAGLRNVPFLSGLSVPWLSVLLNFVCSTAACLILTWLLHRLWISDFLFRPSRFFSRVATRLRPNQS